MGYLDNLDNKFLNKYKKKSFFPYNNINKRSLLVQPQCKIHIPDARKKKGRDPLTMGYLDNFDNEFLNKYKKKILK
jgi:hypothetical protein